MSQSAPRKRFLPAPVRWLLFGLAGVVVLLVVGTAVVMALGITVSGAPWRGQLAQSLSAAIGREVRFEGPLEMQPTLTPSFRVGGITVANPSGFATPFFASLGDARLRVDLLALLRGEVRVRELAATGVTVHLERNAQAQVNWLLQVARAPAASPQPAAKAGSSVRLVEIDAIDLEQIRVDYVAGPGFPRHEFFLDQLHGEADAGQAIAVDMKGTVEGRFPYSAAFRGGALAALGETGKPWPVDFSLGFLGTTLIINGNVHPDAARPRADLTVALGTEDLSQLERLLQVTLPPVGASGLSMRVTWQEGVLDISDLRAVMGNTSLDGKLRVDITRPIPRVQGAFMLPVMDLTPFRARKPEAAPEPGAKTTVDLEAIKRRQFQFRELALVEADLSLQVARVQGVPGEVRDAALEVALHGGVLKAPVKATVAEVPLIGAIFLDGASPVPAFALDLGVRDSALGQLGRLLAGADGVQGRLGSFTLHFAANGANVPALTQTLEMKLRMEKADVTYGNVKGGRPVEARLDLLDITLPSGGRLQGELRGALLREPFTARFKGGDLATLENEIRWPLELTATGSGATLEVRGTVGAPEKNGGTDITLKLASPRAGSVARWLGLSPKTQAPVSIAGRVVVQSDEWRLNDLDVQLGKTRLRADLARVDIERNPLVQAKVRLDNLELAELEAMLPPPKPGPAKAVIELPILPRGIDLTDADVDVAIKRIALKPAAVTDISFLGRIRQGSMHASPFGARYLDTLFQGAMALDLRGQLPRATVWVAAQKADIGNMLKTLGLADGLRVRTDAVVLQLDAKGHRLGEMLESSALLLTVDGGELLLGDEQSRNPLRIALSKGLVEAKPREPVHLDLDGAIDATPVKIRIASGSVIELLRAASFVPFEMTAETAGTELGLNGKVSLPITRKALELDLSIKGNKVSSLDELARTPLPHWGPYALRSRFRVSAGGYEMPDMTLRVASSELKGKGSLLTSGERPRVALQLSAPRIQLDDFKLEGWALAERKPAAEGEKPSEEALRKKAREASAQTEKVLSPEALRRQDVELAVDVTEVLSGRDRLGSGSLRARLRDGRLSVEPAEVSVPGGAARLWFSYFPDGKTIDIESKIRVERFDYGVLARRYKPDADVQGQFSLQMDLRTRTPSLERAMQYGNGRIDFAVWPKDMKSGIFDLWAVNLFVALVPAVDAAKESKVNCAVGRFNLKNGVLTDDSILLDTSRMRVAGKARVDFESESLSVDLAPKPKKPQFFSLATPVEVRGKLTAPKIGVSAGQVAGTAAKFFASIITTPLQMLFSKEMPRDGADVCAGAVTAGRDPG